MLMVSSNGKDHVDACRAQVAAQLAGNLAVPAAEPPDIGAFERRFLNHMILALDRYLVHRGRTMAGKDGNPLSEVRMLCDAIMENRDRISANKTIRCQPENSIQKLEPGDEIRLDADDFARRSATLFDEIEKEYP
jgi:hypothetical protein